MKIDVLDAVRGEPFGFGQGRRRAVRGELAEIQDNVELDEFVVMPNHIHSTIVITESCVGATSRSPLRSRTMNGTIRQAHGKLMAGFDRPVLSLSKGSLRVNGRGPIFVTATNTEIFLWEAEG